VRDRARCPCEIELGARASLCETNKARGTCETRLEVRARQPWEHEQNTYKILCETEKHGRQD